MSSRNRPLSIVIFIDEFHHVNHQYIFKIIDDKTLDLIGLFPDRTNKNIRKYLSKYALTNRQHVQFVVTDMIANYSATLRRMFPNAQIIIDRFHIIQLAMKDSISYESGPHHVP